MNLLSILIPSIPARADKLNILLAELSRQKDRLEGRSVHKYPGTDEQVEIIVNDSPSFRDGGLAIGSKRDVLRANATGKYICFLDDDEGIAPNYLEVLYDLCKSDKDVCTFQSIAKLEGFWCIIDMSLNYKTNQQAKPGIVKRPPWHICPVKRELALKYEFTNTNYGEDWLWFSKVLSHCTTQARAKKIIHQYNHKEKSEADRASES